MQFDTNTIISATKANQNFSSATRIAEKNGHAIILKNNRPRFMPVDLEKSPVLDMTDDERIDVVAARILKKFKPAFEECHFMEKEIYNESNGLYYTLHGDYYLPNLVLPESAKVSFGKYGILRREYLKEHRPVIYETMLLSGKLFEHLAEVDSSCRGHDGQADPRNGKDGRNYRGTQGTGSDALGGAHE